MNKYFELRDKTGTYYGVITNIPEDTSLEEIKKRIETKDKDEELILVDGQFLTVDIEMDWESLDYEQEIDHNLVDVSDCLVGAIDYKLETEVVYTALKYMKENPDSTISDAINYGYNEWVK